MRVTPEEIRSLLASAPRTTRRPKWTSLNRLVGKIRRLMLSAIDERMQAPMALLDVAIRFLLAFESYQFARGLTVENREFVVHITRLRSDTLAIREMILIGQESAALALARVFFEDIEIAMGLAIDPQFSLAYGEASDDSDFWAKQIGYGKNYPRVRRFLEIGGNDAEAADGKLNHHKQLKSFLSSHIHPTNSSALRAVFPPTFEHPGMFLERPIGSLGECMHPLCLTLADEVYMFSACCINMFISPNPPLAFAGFKPSGEMDDFIASALVLQELVLKHLKPLWHTYEEAVTIWYAGVSSDET